MSQRVVTCSSCGAKYRIPDTFGGSKATCKKCNNVIEIPPLGAEPEEEAPAPEPEAAKPARPARRGGGGGSTRRGGGRPSRARAAAAEEEAEEEAPRRGGGRRGGGGGGGRRSGGRAAGGRAGGRRGGGRRGGGVDEEMEGGGGNTGVIVGVIAAVVVVAAVAVYFLVIKDDTPAGPTPEQIAAQKAEEAKKAKEAEEAKKREDARKAREAREEEERKKREAEARKAAENKTPAKGEVKTAKSGEKYIMKMSPEVDLESFEPLEFAAETSSKKREEIKELVEAASDPWGGAAQGRAITKLRQIGYHAVPAIVNVLIDTKKCDYFKKDGVDLAFTLCRLLGDICNGQGVQVRNMRNKKLDKDPWDNDWDIRWNRQVANSWYKLWQKFGKSKRTWEKQFERKKKK